MDRGQAHGAVRRDDRAKALELTRAQIEKQFGKGVDHAAGREQDLRRLDAISTGSLALDIALGIGGLPRGRVVEIYGPEGSGKTTVALSVIANCQKTGGMAAFIDAEHALDPIYARKLGVDIDNLLVSQPDTGEQALEITEMLVRSGAVDIIVIDSVAALVPRAEIEGEMGDTHVGLQARLMSQALRKLTGAIAKTNTLVIFINQIRMKIGVMFGNPETTTGGNALKFYSSVRLDIRRIGAITQGEDVIGNQVRVKVVKNKVAPPFKKAEFDILYGEGISKEGDLIDLGVAADVIQKSGAWYSFGEERLGQGRENVRIFLKENPDLYETIKELVFKHYGIGEPADRGRGQGQPTAAKTAAAKAAEAARPAAGRPRPNGGGQGRRQGAAPEAAGSATDRGPAPGEPASSRACPREARLLAVRREPDARGPGARRRRGLWSWRPSRCRPDLPGAGRDAGPAACWPSCGLAAERKRVARRLFAHAGPAPACRWRACAASSPDEGYDPAAVDAVLEQMAARGLHSDRHYAEAWCRDCLARHGRWAAAIWRPSCGRRASAARGGRAAAEPRWTRPPRRSWPRRAAAGRWRRVRRPGATDAPMAKVVRFLQGRGFDAGAGLPGGAAHEPGAGSDRRSTPKGTNREDPGDRSAGHAGRAVMRRLAAAHERARASIWPTAI